MPEPTIDLSGTNLGNAVNKATADLNAEGYKSPDIKEIGGQIKESGSLPVIQTTTSSRAQTDSNMEEFNQMQNQRQNNTINNTPETPKPSTEKPSVSTTEPTDETLGELQHNVQGAKDSAQSTIDGIQSNLEQLKSMGDAQLSSQIQNLTSSYEARKKGVEDAYDRLGKSKQTSALRSGLARYASDQANGILTDNEVQGHVAVADLTRKLNEEITKATNAKATNDRAAFNTAWQNIKSTKSALATQVASLEKQAVDYQKAKIQSDQSAQKAHSQKITESIKMSNAVAPYLHNEISGMSKTEGDAFIKKYADVNDIPYEFLSSSVTDYGKKGAKSTTPSNPVFSTGDIQSLNQAGLGNHDEKTKSFYTNTPTAFKEWYTHKYAQGDIPPAGVNTKTIGLIYDEWNKRDTEAKAAAKTSKGTSGGKTPAGGNPFLPQ